MFALTDDRIKQLQEALVALASDQCLGVSVPFFTSEEISALCDMVDTLPMRKARDRVSHKGIVVHQDFDICFPAPKDGYLGIICQMLEDGMNTANSRLKIPVFAEPLELNDRAIQRYPKASKGIGVHRDGLRYRQIVIIITLAGESRFCLCDDRDGNGAVVLNDTPGHLVLLSAPGFANRDGDNGRPLHFVDQVSGGRLSIGLRQESA